MYVVSYYLYKNGQTKLLPKTKQSLQPFGQQLDDGLPTYSEEIYGTFVNPYLGYSLQLPKNWYAYIANIEAGIESTSYINSPKLSGGTFSIGTENLYKHLTFEENVNEWYNYYSSSTSGLGNFKTEVTENKIDIDTKKGIRYDIYYLVNGVPNKATWIYLPYSSEKLISIKYSSSDTALFDQYNQVFLTLTFLDRSGK